MDGGTRVVQSRPSRGSMEELRHLFDGLGGVLDGKYDDLMVLHRITLRFSLAFSPLI